MKARLTYSLIAVVLIVLGCSSSKVLTYWYGVNKVDLNSDCTFVADYRHTGRVRGSWRMELDTLILNSEYRLDSLRNIATNYSRLDTGLYCMLNLRDKQGYVPKSAEISLWNESHDTTLNLIYSDWHRIEKRNAYTYCQIVIYHRDGRPKSTIFNIKTMDTTTIIIDYPSNYSNYPFSMNDRFLVDKEKSTIVPLLK